MQRVLLNQIGKIATSKGLVKSMPNISKGTGGSPEMATKALVNEYNIKKVTPKVNGLVKTKNQKKTLLKIPKMTPKKYFFNGKPSFPTP